MCFFILFIKAVININNSDKRSLVGKLCFTAFFGVSQVFIVWRFSKSHSCIQVFVSSVQQQFRALRHRSALNPREASLLPAAQILSSPCTLKATQPKHEETPLKSSNISLWLISWALEGLHHPSHPTVPKGQPKPWKLFAVHLKKNPGCSCKWLQQRATGGGYFFFQGKTREAT